MNNRVVINWELSLACNLDCSFCSQKERRKLNSKIPDIENIYKIIDNLPKNSHISFLWWETLIVPNIIDIFKKLEEKEITYEITTNGILLDKFFDDLVEWKNNPSLNSFPKIREGGYNKIENLKHLTQINISIDWYGDFHDFSRWKKWLFKKLQKIIPKILEIKNVSVSTVITQELENFNLIKLHLWLDSIWIKEHKLIYLMNFSEVDIKNSIEKIPELKIWKPGSEKLDNEMLKKDFLRKVSLLKNLNKKIQLKIEPIALFQNKKLSCKQLDKQLRIDENGRLSICEFITNSFDDITKVRLEEAVKNWEYMKLKEVIKDNFPLDICRSCCKLYN